jgi:hypothetical protein
MKPLFRGSSGRVRPGLHGARRGRLARRLLDAQRCLSSVAEKNRSHLVNPSDLAACRRLFSSVITRQDPLPAEFALTNSPSLGETLIEDFLFEVR